MQVITAETYNGNTLKTSTDYFALPADREIFGTGNSSNSTEAASLVQFTWYATSTNRIKKSGGNDAVWWERSPSASSSGYFHVDSSNGNPNNYSADSDNGLSPFGCI